MSYDSQEQERMVQQLTKCFKDHKAEHGVLLYVDYFTSQSPAPGVPVGNAEMLLWNKPGSSIYSVRYIVNRNTLFVGGDLGHAVYRWSDNVTINWLASCDLHYFMGKFEGLDCGSRPNQWDPKRVEHYMKEWLEEDDGENRKRIGWDETDLELWPSMTYSEDEWVRFIGQEGNRMLIDDEAYKWGQGLNLRCVAHWLGLKLAVEQLQQTTKAQEKRAAEALATEM